MINNSVDETAALSVVNLCTQYGPRQVITDVTIRIQSGEIFGVIGANGAGKSTLVKAICGRIAPSAGSISIMGEPLSSPAARGCLGLAPQNPALFANLTVMENIVAFAEYAGAAPALARQQALETITRTGLHDVAEQRAARLSGGLRQRVNIAAAIVHRPRLLILDEPCANIDPDGVEALNSFISNLADDGLAILLITHDMTQAENICTRVGVLHAGRLLADDTPASLIAAHGGDAYCITVRTHARHAAASDDQPADAPMGAQTDLSALGFNATNHQTWRKTLPAGADLAEHISALTAMQGAAAMGDVQITREGLHRALTTLQTQGAP